MAKGALTRRKGQAGLVWCIAASPPYVPCVALEASWSRGRTSTRGGPCWRPTWGPTHSKAVRQWSVRATRRCHAPLTRNGQVINSWPASGTQPWHRDFGCAAVMTPLVDLTALSGPTEFVLCSHRLAPALLTRPPAAWLDFSERANQWLGTLLSSGAARVATYLLAPLRAWLPLPVAVRGFLSRGSVVVFDCRVLHRGLPNRGAVSRPIVSFDYQHAERE